MNRRQSRSAEELRDKLEDLYARFNRREYVHPDPLEFLYDYPDPADREIVGLIASSLAYGNVGQILKSVSLILKPLGRSPRLFLEERGPEEIRVAFDKFKHRWHTGEDMGLMLVGAKRVLEKFGSLGACFRAGYHEGDTDVLPALEFFVSEITHGAFHNASPPLRGGDTGEGDPGATLTPTLSKLCCAPRDREQRAVCLLPSGRSLLLTPQGRGGILSKNLLPLPTRGSACKRLLMYLRWMVRKDEVDPGGWDEIPASKLLVPVDTHMHRMARRLRFTKRKQANLATVREITAGFRKIAPDDPARYDFTLTRFGIRKDLNWQSV